MRARRSGSVATCRGWGGRCSVVVVRRLWLVGSSVGEWGRAGLGVMETNR